MILSFDPWRCWSVVGCFARLLSLQGMDNGSRIHKGGDHMERLLLGGYMDYFGRRGTLGASMASPLPLMFWLTSRNS